MIECILHFIKGGEGAVKVALSRSEIYLDRQAGLR